MKTPADRYGFLRESANWRNHLPLMLLAFEATKNAAHPILELGYNNDSSPLVQQYCKHEGRRAVLVDDDILRCAEARRQLDSLHYDVQCCSYDEAAIDREAARWSVAIIANKPGERRQRDARRLAERASIIILRDTEPAADYGYKYSEAFTFFRWRVDIKSDGAWASAVSNSIDLIKEWRGMRLGPYTISGPDDDVTVSETAQKLKDFQAGKVDWQDPEANGIKLNVED